MITFTDEVIQQLVDIHGLEHWNEGDWDLFYALIKNGYTINGAIEEVEYDIG